jgi:hypothetical protein
MASKTDEAAKAAERAAKYAKTRRRQRALAKKRKEEEAAYAAKLEEEMGIDQGTIQGKLDDVDLPPASEAGALPKDTDRVVPASNTNEYDPLFPARSGKRHVEEEYGTWKKPGIQYKPEPFSDLRTEAVGISEAYKAGDIGKEEAMRLTADVKKRWLAEFDRQDVAKARSKIKVVKKPEGPPTKEDHAKNLDAVRNKPRPMPTRAETQRKLVITNWRQRVKDLKMTSSGAKTEGPYRAEHISFLENLVKSAEEGGDMVYLEGLYDAFLKGIE